MQITRTYLIRSLRIGGMILIGILIILYAIWRSFNYARGPEIIIIEPKNGSTITTNSIEIKGQAIRVNELYLNGNTLTMDEKGNFSNTILVFPGKNIITINAKDQFGRSTAEELDLWRE